MNVYDTANRLAYEIQQSEEYKEYKKSKETLMGNTETKKKIEDFEKLRYEVQLLEYTGEEKTKKKIKNYKRCIRFLCKTKKLKNILILK